MQEASKQVSGPCVSIGIFAWNEEEAIPTTLHSLFEQSFFKRLAERGQSCEVLCVLNGCTDRTAAVAAEAFAGHVARWGGAAPFSARVEELAEKGKMNAWNQFVHRLSSPDAKGLIMMDADILIDRPDTLWNMFQVLEQDPEAVVAVDLPCKAMPGNTPSWLRGRLSAGATEMTRAAEAQLCGQLYAIRASHARNIHLPRDLGACEDGFLKAMVCTDLLTHEVWPGRIRLAPGAGHTFEAYTSLGTILKNQKRQIIGQTIVHVLVDKYLASLPREQRQSMAAVLRAKDCNDPGWVKRLISLHLREVRHFWRLYPRLLSQYVLRLAKVSGVRRVACIPSALTGLGVAFVASFMAFRTLRSGVTSYWPKARRVGLKEAIPALSGSARLGANQ